MALGGSSFTLFKKEPNRLQVAVFTSFILCSCSFLISNFSLMMLFFLKAFMLQLLVVLGILVLKLSILILVFISFLLLLLLDLLIELFLEDRGIILSLESFDLIDFL
jgi:hypothetical protein